MKNPALKGFCLLPNNRIRSLCHGNYLANSSTRNLLGRKPAKLGGVNLANPRLNRYRYAEH